MKSIEVSAEDLLLLISGDVAHIIVGNKPLAFPNMDHRVRVVLRKGDALELLSAPSMHPPRKARYSGAGRAVQ